MTRKECQNLIDAYLAWLRKGLSAQDLNGACELTTPFLDRHNDHLQIYAIKENGKIILSDDGYILADLRTSGLEMSTPKRQAVLDSVLNGLGVKSDQKRLYIEASQRNVGQRLHCLVQAMITINDMFVMAQPRVASYFGEDVRLFLEGHDVRYSPRVKLAGRTGFDHAIDFLIPKSKKMPERLVQAINAPNKNTIGTYLFSLGDTRDARERDSVAYAFLNDTNREVGGDVIEALEAYEVNPALWTRRDQYVEALAG